MAELFDHIEYLSREIGPRPAGTEEEQDSALYIADQFQRGAGFRAEIEEFTSSANLEGARAIPAVLIVVVVVLAMLFNVVTIPALILTIIAAAVYALEAFDRPLISRALARGASQNVVAKYQPTKDEAGAGKGSRSRKVVLVAHYDTGKVQPRLLKLVSSTGVPLGYITLGGMALSILLLLVRIFVGSSGGVVTIVLNVLTVIALIAVALPVIKALLVRFAPYNEGANNNASGVAAILEIAQRISEGSSSEADLALASEDAVVHGEDAARENDLIPEGAELVYEANQPSRYVDDEEYANYNEEERLQAAKAAIAALTGHPVESHVHGEGAAPAVAEWAEQAQTDQAQTSAEGAQFGESAVLGAEAHVPENAQSEPPSEQVKDKTPAQPIVQTAPEIAPLMPKADSGSMDIGGFQNAPSWFVAAQKNAKKPTAEVSQAQRSRYSQAFEAAERDLIERERLRREAEQRQREEEALYQAALAAQEAAAHKEEQEQAPADQQSVPVSEPQPVQVGEELREAIPPVVSVPPVAEEDLDKTVAHAPISAEEIEELAGMVANEQQEVGQKQGRLPDLPSIDVAETASADETANPSRSGMFRKLRADIPSLSGEIRTLNASQEPVYTPMQSQAPTYAPVQNQAPEVAATPRAGSRASRAAMPSSAAGANEQLTIDYDMDVPVFDDLDPVSAPAGVRPSAEYAAAPARGGVEMPATRADGFLGRLRNTGSDPLDETPQEWLNVDENFDARTVGRERGGWESFRNDSNGDDAPGVPADSKNWHGGAFSRVHLDHVDTRSTESGETDASPEMTGSALDKALNEEIGQIIHFRNPQYNTEIWFVAIGSDTELHDGAQAFVNEHRSELRGAMVVEVESLGAGVLSCASEEGQFRKVKASSRAKRFTRPATEATGIAVEEVSLAGSDSITSTIQKAGFQAMHLFGMEGGRQALKGSADDVIENIDELTLEENISFLMELLKNA